VFSSTRDAKALGIETAFQHLALVDCLSIEKNIYLGKEITKRICGIEILQNKAMKQGALKFLSEVGFNIPDPNRPVEGLSEGKGMPWLSASAPFGPTRSSSLMSRRRLSEFEKQAKF
jgi:simple sugar transport system ATP-binding protein